MSVANKAKLDRYAREDAAYWTPERIAEQKAANEAQKERQRVARQSTFNSIVGEIGVEVIAIACVTNKIGYEVMETVMDRGTYTPKQAAVFSRIISRANDDVTEEVVAAAVTLFRAIAKKRWGVE